MSFLIDGKEVILLGDTTTHGGRVITASSDLEHKGIKVARVGDLVACPRCNGTYPIVEGAPSAFDHDSHIARHGDKIACGATLISSSATVVSGSSMAAVDRPQSMWPGVIIATPDEVCDEYQAAIADPRVQAKMEEAERQTKQNNVEYGGYIYKTKDGGYDMTLGTSNQEKTHSLGEPPEGTVGTYHTHSETGVKDFSDTDIGSSDKRPGMFDIVHIPGKGRLIGDRNDNKVTCGPGGATTKPLRPPSTI